MMGHKICFYEEIWLIIPKLTLLPFLSGVLILTTSSMEIFRTSGFMNIGIFSCVFCVHFSVRDRNVMC